jgi:hypothetical protein
MTAPVEIFVPITFFALIGFVVYFTTKFSYQTKKAILDKGGKIEVVKRKFPLIEIGLTVLGVSLGLALSVIPQTSSLPEESKGLLIGACILLFGGLGLVAAFFVRKRFDEKK